MKRVKKIRKSTKYIFIIIALAIIMIFLCDLFKNISNTEITQTKEIYYFSNNFDYNYQVNLLPNEYVGKIGNIDNVNAYLTNLIDTIDFDLKYEYTGEKESKLKYTYQILGKIQVFYEKNGQKQKVLEQEDVLKQGNEETVISDGFKIEEDLTLDLKQKNTLLNSLKQTTGATLDSKYILELKVNTTTSIDDEIVEEEFSKEIKINLGEKITEIQGNKNNNETKYISKEYKEQSKKTLSMIVDIIGICIAIVLLKFAMKSQVQNIIKNEYKKELNKILRLCRDRIIETSTKPAENNIVDIIDFGEIAKLSEDVNEPILYYFDEKNERAYFYIINNNRTYRFILKA